MDETTNILSNQAGITLTGTWVIPTVVGTPGTIQNTVTGANGYLSVNDNTDAGSVVVEEALDSSDVGQQWERSDNLGSGFFNLKNPNSGLFLTMKTADRLTIGNAYFFAMLFFYHVGFFYLS